MNQKPVILTGLRANNDLHLGNYFGAIQPIVDMSIEKSDEYKINLFLPDLHSFTTQIDHTKLKQQIVDTARIFLASGLNISSPDVVIYRQSYVSAHSELQWILGCFTGLGELGRMTQFKEKTKITKSTALSSIIEAKQKLGDEYWEDDPTTAINDISRRRQVTAGLFNYPVLMAADILLYNAKYVPVGDDQTQHLEFTRDLAERMNSRFGNIFTIPEPVKKQHEFFGKEQGLRIRDLADPAKKMSKSEQSEKGVIFLTDDPDSAYKKIISATTDSNENIVYDYEESPGISNLLDLLILVSGQNKNEVLAKYKGQKTYGPLKNDVAENVSKFLFDFQEKLKNISNEDALDELENGEKSAKFQADETLVSVQKAVGLR